MQVLFRQQCDTVSQRSRFKTSLTAGIFCAEMPLSDSESITGSVCSLELILLFGLWRQDQQMMSYSVVDQYSITVRFQTCAGIS